MVIWICARILVERNKIELIPKFISFSAGFFHSDGITLEEWLQNHKGWVSACKSAMITPPTVLQSKVGSAVRYAKFFSDIKALQAALYWSSLLVNILAQYFRLCSDPSVTQLNSNSFLIYFVEMWDYPKFLQVGIVMYVGTHLKVLFDSPNFIELSFPASQVHSLASTDSASLLKSSLQSDCDSWNETV